MTGAKLARRRFGGQSREPSEAAISSRNDIRTAISISILTGDRLREECGVFGIFGHPDAAAITALGLHALQHRGQEAAGIVAFDGRRFHSERRLGLVGDHFSNVATIERLPGSAAVGHVRYSTTGETILRNVQPLFAELDGGGLAVAHNGNLTNGLTLAARIGPRRRDLPIDFRHRSDSSSGGAFASARASSTVSSNPLRQIEGAYALVALTNKKLIGARDPLGIRPLVLGELNGCPILCSETCALDIIGAKFVRDVENGEVVVISRDGVESLRPFPPQRMRPCIFEYIYFARPDSIVHGRSVYEARKAMGAELAREAPAEADVVVPVPDFGRAGGARLCPDLRHSVRTRHYPQPLCRPHLHPADPGDPRARRSPEAQRQSFGHRRQAGRSDRRFDRARHDFGENRADDARSRRRGGAFSHFLAADYSSRLLRHRHARARQAAGGAHGSRRNARVSWAPTAWLSSPSTAFIAPWAMPGATMRSRNSPIIASPATIRPG